MMNNAVEGKRPNEPILTKKDRHKAALRYMFMGVNNFNYETQQGPAVVFSLNKALRKIYSDDQEYIESLNNHFKYFNTTTAMANIILGASLAIEERDGGKSIESVKSLKTSLMGPFAGVGDTLIWILIPTILGSISGYMALEGNPVGAVMWLVFNLIFAFVKLKLWDLGYSSGVKLVTTLGEKLTIFTEAASVMGLTVVGALISTAVKVQTGLTFKTGAVKLPLQSDVLDKIMPALLPVLLTIVVYKLIGSKRWTTTRIIVLLIVISMVGAFFGILKPM
ncbi:MULTISPECIES: PTS system mannose/fructose/sorbose family transporter subunit IID [Enterococcus]|uniref:PTS system mannose/fructose/sorbose family transporter subunit IID n=1 Tax=Enterococcus TaxID=1350 RepID=UPI000EE0A7EB|nr:MULTISPECIES: PTS system mannose/fructose/sorbose family transporter subunit IID [Enterococcus]HCM87333.1 PTS fructose transporter subunit IID [Enterococcus sp.]